MTTVTQLMPPPAEQVNVPREGVPLVVGAMLLEPQVKWVAVIYQDTIDGVDRFQVVAYTCDPTQ